jgi:3-oxoacyl-[acyl-carrier-protein] synthase-1
MAAQPIAIVHAGMVTSVGLSAPATCAAIRAGLTHHTDTRFHDAGGDWIAGAQVALDQPWRGREKLAQMLFMAIDECLTGVSVPLPAKLPVLLCVAEKQRVGRLDGLDDALLPEVMARLGVDWHPDWSGVIAYGRVAAAVALTRARELLYDRSASHVLIAAVDSLLLAKTLKSLESDERLLSERNTNGFVPGEAAGALLVSRHGGPEPHVICTGLGFSEERSSIGSDAPLRGDGLTTAINNALADAGCQMHDLDFRITDNSGEQYYFKEAALALTRAMKVRKAEFDIWHPADCVGETGAAIGTIAFGVALAASRKSYAPGPNILFHSGNDAGQRAAATLRFSEVP